MKIINLLPKDKQKELQYEALFRSLVRFVEISLVTFMLVFMVQLGVRVYLRQQADKLNVEIEQVKQLSNKQENAALKLRIGEINSEVRDLNTLAEETPAWSRVLRAFAAQVPQQISVDSLQLEQTKKRIDIHGTSPTRDAVIQLYNNINLDKEHFYDIDYPLENVQKPDNVIFHFTFFIKDDLLKDLPPRDRKDK